MKPNYKLTILTAVPGLLVADYAILMIYTAYYYRDDFFKALEATTFSGIVFPVSATYHLRNILFKYILKKKKKLTI